MNTNTAKAQLKKELAKFFLTPDLKMIDGYMRVGKAYKIGVLKADLHLLQIQGNSLMSVTIGDAKRVAATLAARYGMLDAQELNKVKNTEIARAVTDSMIDLEKTKKLVQEWEHDHIVDIEHRANAMKLALLNTTVKRRA